MLLPMVMFYGALALPLPGMLALAFVGGLMNDALNTQYSDGVVEIAAGWSIILYAALGTIMSGFRPLFQRGRWEIHCHVQRRGDGTAGNQRARCSEPFRPGTRCSLLCEVL